MKKDYPKISVILPVYNGEAYLVESINSILNQNFKDFELIIINDGSIDRSEEIIQSFLDPRIKYYKQENQGLAKTLNIGILKASSSYIARQDQDDISLPSRLQTQYEFLEKNLTIGMVGTWSDILEGDLKSDASIKHALDNENLKINAIFSSVMIRREVFDNIGLYSEDPERQPPEDFELWSRIVNNYEVANVPEVLHLYRKIPTNMSHTQENEMTKRVIKLSTENLLRFVNEFPKEEIFSLMAVYHNRLDCVTKRIKFNKIRELFLKLETALCEKYNLRKDIVRVNLNEKLVELKPKLRKVYYGKFFGGILNKSCRFIQRIK